VVGLAEIFVIIYVETFQSDFIVYIYIYISLNLIGIYIYLKKKINSTKYLPYSEKYDDLEIILCYVLRCFAWFGFKFPQSRMKGEQHRLSPLSLWFLFWNLQGKKRFF
jgi:hypothetical protein